MMTVDFDPVIFHLGPLQVRWYGLMYVIGFGMASFFLKHLIKHNFLQIQADKIDQMVTYALVGTFVGARSFYVFIYNWDYYSKHLLDIPAVWKGGLSFHGAMVGIMVAISFFAIKHKIPIMQVWDAATVPAPFGVFFGRLGNFINGELYGRVTDVSWGMIFPAGGPYPRHPSQLYEAFGEGLLIFCILMLLFKRVKYYGILGGLYLILYGTVRYIIEFFREADAQLGYYFGGTTTMGQILCLCMIAGGVFLIVFACKKKIPNQAYKAKV